MLNWLERNALRVILLLAVAVMMASSMYWEGVARAAATAAQPAPPEVVPCAPINTAGLIVVYRCSPEQGAPYIINSLGFMMLEP